MTDLPLLALVAGVVSNLLTGLVTKARAAPYVKAWANLAISALLGALTTLTGPLTLRRVVVAAGAAWVTSMASLYGFTRPAGLAAAVGRIAPEVGIGAPVAPTPAADPDPPVTGLVIPGDEDYTREELNAMWRRGTPTRIVTEKGAGWVLWRSPPTATTTADPTSAPFISGGNIQPMPDPYKEAARLKSEAKKPAKKPVAKKAPVKRKPPAKKPG